MLLSGVWVALNIFGCVESSMAVIEPNEIVNYGIDPMRHTFYIGSDTKYHYFSWNRGFHGGGIWKVERDKLEITCEFPLDSGSLPLSQSNQTLVDCPE